MERTLSIHAVLRQCVGFHSHRCAACFCTFVDRWQHTASDLLVDRSESAIGEIAKCSPRPDVSPIVNVVTRSGRSRSAEEILHIAFSSDVERNYLDDEDFSLQVEDCESTESDSDDERSAANSRGASCTSRPLVR